MPLFVMIRRGKKILKFNHPTWCILQCNIYFAAKRKDNAYHINFNSFNPEIEHLTHQMSCIYGTL